MAHGKCQFCTWRCRECKKAHSVSAYLKRRDAEIVKELPKFCNQCRKHTTHFRKDTKRGN